MKTNQMMEVKIGDYGSILIGHKTKMGKVKDIMAIGNLIREQKGLRPIELEEILRSQNFWEFVVSYYNSNSAESAELKIDFEVIKDKHGKIQYKKLISKFPELIQSKRGKYGGTWMNLYLLLKVAVKLDTDLEVQIYKTFIEGKILQLRDSGGDNFKKLNRLISGLDGFDPAYDKHYYKEIARLIRHKIFDLPNYDNYKNIWNEEIATQDKLDERDAIEDKLCMLINEGFINSYHQLWKYLGGKDPKIEKFILGDKNE